MNIENIIETFATMINRGMWDVKNVPPQIIEEVKNRVEKLKGGESK